MPGSGKTTIGKKLSEITNYNFVDMDDYIVNKVGESVQEIFDKGEELFRKYETNACYELGKKNNTIISTGGGVVKVSGNMDYFSNDTVVFINRSVEDIISSVDTVSRPLLKDGVDKIYALYQERIHLYKKYANIVVNNNGHICSVIEEIKEIVDNENNVN